MGGSSWLELIQRVQGRRDETKAYIIFCVVIKRGPTACVLDISERCFTKETDRQSGRRRAEMR